MGVETGTDGEALAVEVRGGQGPSPVVVLVGELDASVAADLRSTLAGLLDARPDALTVAMDRLAFIDSVGLSVLVSTHRQAAASGVALVLERPTATCLRVLEITGLTSVLDVRP